jgi:predicted amidohydrolase YtcJ
MLEVECWLFALLSRSAHRREQVREIHPFASNFLSLPKSICQLPFSGPYPSHEDHAKPKRPMRLCNFIVIYWLFASSAFAAPDLILHHGRIVTVDKNFSIQQAVAIESNRIVQVGDDDSILKLKGEKTEMIDLAGRMVLPGLIDSHTHPLSAAMTEFDHPIPDMGSIADVLSYFRERAQVVKPREWIVLQQVFITRLREQRYPTRAELDSAAPEHPAVFRTGPDASFNSLALKASGIDAGFKIPEGIAGKIEKDADGNPTGILRNFANYAKLPDKSKPATNAQKTERLIELFKDYNSAGITAIGDRNAGSGALDMYQELRRRGDLTVRVAASHELSSLGSLSNIVDNLRRIASHPLAKGRDEMLRLIGVKMFLDGGMLTGSAYMREPWGVSEIYSITDPQYRGVLFIPRERLRPIVQATVESGLQFTAHSVGDGAVQTLVEVYEELAREKPIRQTRPCITHANFLTADIVKKLPEIGAVLDVQPAWLYLDAHTLLKQFGNQRLRWFQPLKSLFAAGAIAGGGSDHMQKIGSFRSINPYNPFLGIATAVTRKARWQESPLHPEEALTREQAIRFYTMNNAYLLFCDDKLGSLEPGKLADLIILDTDLLTCAAEQIVRTKVLKTFLNGKLVFTAPH